MTWARNGRTSRKILALKNLLKAISSKPFKKTAIAASMYLIIIVANIWIKFARARNIAPLLERLVTYQFIPVVNNYLLVEIFDALVENKWMHKKQATDIVNFIRKVALIITEKAVYRLSPDPKDNYLFDLAVQNNCVFIISDDSKLLQFKLKPISVHSSSWFLKKFPVQ